MFLRQLVSSKNCLDAKTKPQYENLTKFSLSYSVKGYIERFCTGITLKYNVILSIKSKI